ncbi:MAG: nucleotidyltransferase family protein [Candidatus Ryanbacteria bacterium]|nr:nucleotidyltransferase family protein [Candidatus Ryanbacteria bacterium]
MKAIILAAGKGTRMRPLTLERPKPLVQIGGRPLIEHIASQLPSEVDEFVIVIGYLGDMIREYCGDVFLGRRVTYVVDDEIKGTYRALEKTKHLLREGERFFVVYADDLHGADGFKECLKHDRALLVSMVEDPRPYGVIEIDEVGYVRAIEEKPLHPKTNMVSTGVLLLDYSIFDHAPAMHSGTGEYFLTHAIEQMLSIKKIMAVSSSFWYPVSTPQDVEQVEMMMQGDRYNQHSQALKAWQI